MTENWVSGLLVKVNGGRGCRNKRPGVVRHAAEYDLLFAGCRTDRRDVRQETYYVFHAKQALALDLRTRDRLDACRNILQALFAFARGDDDLLERPAGLGVLCYRFLGIARYRGGDRNGQRALYR